MCCTIVSIKLCLLKGIYVNVTKKIILLNFKLNNILGKGRNMPSKYSEENNLALKILSETITPTIANSSLKFQNPSKFIFKVSNSRKKSSNVKFEKMQIMLRSAYLVIIVSYLLIGFVASKVCIYSGKETLGVIFVRQS